MLSKVSTPSRPLPSTPEEPLDRMSVRILDALQEDGRMSVQALSERVGLSPAPCWRRVRALEESGVISRYTAVVDPARVGLSACMLTQISLDRHNEAAVESFEQAVQEFPEILECFVVTGDADYLLKIVVRDNAAFEALLQKFLARVKWVRQARTSVALRQVKSVTRVPLD